MRQALRVKMILFHCLLLGAVKNRKAHILIVGWSEKRMSWEKVMMVITLSLGLYLSSCLIPIRRIRGIYKRTGTYSTREEVAKGGG